MEILTQKRGDVNISFGTATGLNLTSANCLCYTFSLENLSTRVYNYAMGVKVYQDTHGNEPFEGWLGSIRDKRTLARIDGRLRRVRLGNLGDHRSVGNGVFELCLDFGPGYRIYFGRIGRQAILLLTGGDKSSQTKDIAKAKQYWNDYKESVQ